MNWLVILRELELLKYYYNSKLWFSLSNSVQTVSCEHQGYIYLIDNYK